VLVGKRDRFRPKVERVAQDLKIASQIRFIEEVADEELPALMRGALALVQPSHVEGFGLPALEALACGTPVIASQASALSEVLGRSALTFPSDDNAKLGDCIGKLIADPGMREKLRAEGAQRAAGFRKEAISRELLQLYRKVAKPRS
jgi:glycosyltransferase involved in cell wall biosynthesis